MTEPIFDIPLLLVYDCDGVLTDNRVLLDETGKESVFFHRGDGYGIRMLKELGVTQVILSTEVNPVVRKRAEKLKIPVIHGVEKKEKQLDEYCRVHNISFDQVMYIGNDLNDLEAMKLVGIRGCPADAEPEIKEICQWISTQNGGQGVIRELYRVLSRKRGIY